MPYIIEGKYSTITAMTDHAVDEATTKQLYAMASSPSINNDPVIMPDLHAGAGAVIGFTMKLLDKLCPNIVGVDIGCGMLTFSVGQNFPFPAKADTVVRSVIPTGRNIHDTPLCTLSELDTRTYATRLHHSRQLGVPFDSYREIFKRAGIAESYAMQSLGTLGGGNHFIEFGRNAERCYITIHTGSRNFGYRIAQHHQKVAESYMHSLRVDYAQDRTAFLKESYKRGIIDGITLGEEIKALKNRSHVQKGLEYLEGTQMNQYLYDMYAAQTYASINRQFIMESILTALNLTKTLAIESIHNYIDPYDRIIRKGAIQANLGQLIIIPINRTFGTIIAQGKGSAAWNFSAPHGAGRTMSRSQAKSLVSQDDATQEMILASVYSSFDPRDESSLSYKNPETILSQITETADIQFIIKPYLNIK